MVGIENIERRAKRAKRPLYFAPVRVWTIAISVSHGICTSVICLFVCLSVCLITYLKNHMPKFHQIFCDITYSRGSVLLWRHCITLRTSGFVDDVIFSYKGGTMPELKTTRIFRSVRQVAALGRSLLSSTAPCSKYVYVIALVKTVSQLKNFKRWRDKTRA